MGGLAAGLRTCVPRNELRCVNYHHCRAGVRRAFVHDIISSLGAAYRFKTVKTATKNPHIQIWTNVEKFADSDANSKCVTTLGLGLVLDFLGFIIHLSQCISVGKIADLVLAMIFSRDKEKTKTKVLSLKIASRLQLGNRVSFQG